MLWAPSPSPFVAIAIGYSITSLLTQTNLLRWSNEITQIHFAKVDVDHLPDVTQEYSVRAMPTFTIFKNGEKVDEFVGANPPALLKLIEKHKGEEKVAESEEATKAE